MGVKEVEQLADWPLRVVVTSTTTRYPIVAREILNGIWATPLLPAVPVFVVVVLL